GRSARVALELIFTSPVGSKTDGLCGTFVAGFLGFLDGTIIVRVTTTIRSGFPTLGARSQEVRVENQSTITQGRLAFAINDRPPKASNRGRCSSGHNTNVRNVAQHVEVVVDSSVVTGRVGGELVTRPASVFQIVHRFSCQS